MNYKSCCESVYVFRLCCVDFEFWEVFVNKIVESIFVDILYNSGCKYYS